MRPTIDAVAISSSSSAISILPDIVCGSSTGSGNSAAGWMDSRGSYSLAPWSSLHNGVPEFLRNRAAPHLCDADRICRGDYAKVRIHLKKHLPGAPVFLPTSGILLVFSVLNTAFQAFFRLNNFQRKTGDIHGTTLGFENFTGRYCDQCFGLGCRTNRFGFP
jgi:hypothetical protein